MARGPVEVEVARRLSERSQTLVTVETSSGGIAASRLTAVPGSSAWFVGGVVPYSADARQRWLGISRDSTRETGAVSAEAALAMARAGRDALGADWAAAETGIAGPQSGRRSTKPVGLAYVAVVGEAGGEPIELVREVSTGLDEREANRESFAAALLQLLREAIEAIGGDGAADAS